MKFCLIGSSRFKDLYDRANRELTLKGHLIYSIAARSSAAGMELPPDDKSILDLVHLRKIQESEAAILITDDTGYYGFSTRREMAWAIMIEKPIFIFVTRDPEESLIVHLGTRFGFRTLYDIPSPEILAKVIIEARSATTDFPPRSAA
jgi:hypothetical protein